MFVLAITLSNSKNLVMTLSMFELKTECFEKGNIGNILHASHNNRRKASGD